MASTKQPVAQHLQELRSRLAWSTAFMLLGTVIAYAIHSQLVSILVNPLNQTLYYTSPGGGFSFLIQICLGFGVVVAIPVIIFHTIRFLAPIIPQYSTKLLIIILVSSSLLTIAGLAFAYYLSLPSALHFLNEFSNQQVQALISTDTYISFITVYLAGFAILFQLPLVLLLINHISRLSSTALLKQTPWIILASLIVAAIITPTPDPFNQLIMAVPIVILYLISISLLVLVNRHQPTQPAVSIEQTFLNLSRKKLVAKQKAYHQGREGYLCQWDSQDKSESIVTFLHDNKHHLVRIYK